MMFTNIYTKAGFNTNGVTCLDWLAPSKIKSLPPDYIKKSYEFGGLNQLYPKSLKSPLNQYDSEIITNGNKLQLSQASEGKADELKAELLEPHINNDKVVVFDTPQVSKREPIDKPHCSRSAGLDNKLQSSSAENTKTQTEEENAKTDKINSEISTPDPLQSSEVSYFAYSSVDTAEGTLLQPIPYPHLPSAVTPIYKEMM